MRWKESISQSKYFQGSVRDLKNTAAALEEAAAEIAKLEEAGATNIPQVSCSATFAEMGQAVSAMADAIPQQEDLKV